MTKKLKNKLIEWAIIYTLLAIVVTVVIIMYNRETKSAQPSIISIDGIAYIEKDGYVSKLLDNNGKQIVYNDQISDEHEIITSYFTDSSGEHTKYIFEDKSTSMIYILVPSDTNNVTLLNVMYNNDWVNDVIEDADDPNTITVITE